MIILSFSFLDRIRWWVKHRAISSVKRKSFVYTYALFLISITAVLIIHCGKLNQLCVPS
jgi:hypothetical protein